MSHTFNEFFRPEKYKNSYSVLHFNSTEIISVIIFHNIFKLHKSIFINNKIKCSNYQYKIKCLNCLTRKLKLSNRYLST